jgi:O-antigen ligase
VALKLGLSHPVIGVGLENFMHAASFYIPYMNVVHNAILQIFSELGLAGLAVFAAIVFYNLRIISSFMRRRDDPDAAQLGRILLVHQLSVLVNSLFLPISYQVVLWFTLALPSIARYAFNR